jgi:antibiotic biosynthesis monooxygenase (ABM) superfamily enzyme
MEWQRGVAGAAEAFAGYRGTDVYPPADARHDEWVAVLHFEDEPSLARWLGSTPRADWVAKLRAKVGEFELQTMPGGFGAWFAGLARGPGAAPPGWKMALAVLLGLYPTVMLLTIFVGPYTSPLGLAVSMLIGNALSVCILQWVVMPGLTAVLGRWLRANAAGQRAVSLGGLGLILVLLALLAVLARAVTG